MKKHLKGFIVAVSVLVVASGAYVVLRVQMGSGARESAVQKTEVPVPMSEPTPVTPVATPVPVVAAKKPATATSVPLQSVTPAAAIPASTAAMPAVTAQAPVRHMRRDGTTQVAGYPEHMAAGSTALAAGDATTAAAEYGAAAQLMPESSDALLHLAEAELALGDADKATKNLDAVDGMVKNPAVTAVLRTRVLMKEGKYADADAAIKLAGDEGLFLRGLLASFFDRPDEAQQILRGMTTGVNAEIAHQILAAYDEAKLWPDSPKTLSDTLLARAYNALGEYGMAEAKVAPVLDSDSSYRDAWLVRGYAEYQMGDYAKAKTAFETAYKLDSVKVETQYYLARTYASLQDLPSAEQFYKLALANGYADKQDVLRNLAEVQYGAGEYADAAASYELILADGTAPVTEYIRPVYVYLEKLRDGASAWRVANDALTKYPNSAEALNLAGWVSVVNGYLPQARQYLEQAVRIDANQPAPFLNLGKYFEAAGDVARARVAYKRAYDLDPNGGVGALAGVAYNNLVGK